MTRSTTTTVTPTRRTLRPAAAALLGMAAWFVVPAASPAAAAEQAGFATAQQTYVAGLVARADAAKGYTQMDDYVRGLSYWHHNPDWGIG